MNWNCLHWTIQNANAHTHTHTTTYSSMESSRLPQRMLNDSHSNPMKLNSIDLCVGHASYYLSHNAWGDTMVEFKLCRRYKIDACLWWTPTRSRKRIKESVWLFTVETMAFLTLMLCFEIWLYDYKSTDDDDATKTSCCSDQNRHDLFDKWPFEFGLHEKMGGKRATPLEKKIPPNKSIALGYPHPQSFQIQSVENQ